MSGAATAATATATAATTAATVTATATATATASSNSWQRIVRCAQIEIDERKTQRKQNETKRKGERKLCVALLDWQLPCGNLERIELPQPALSRLRLSAYRKNCLLRRIATL